jgi:hypothetical protein
LGGEPNHWSLIGRASVEPDLLTAMDPIAFVGGIAAAVLVIRCYTF